MKKLKIFKSEFNQYSDQILFAGFMLVQSSGSDQYTSNWEDIMEIARVAIAEDTDADEDDIDLSIYTNSDILQYIYRNSYINGNNHELLMATLDKGVPTINILEIL